MATFLAVPAAVTRSPLESSSLASSLKTPRALTTRPSLPLAFTPLRRSHAPSRVVCSADHASAARPRPGEKKGFVEEMRFVAMKLHTKDQAPKEGQREASKTPLAKWEPTTYGYAQFLVDSKAVYDTLESIIADGSSPMYSSFQKTGLERSGPLARDLAWMKEEGYTIPPVGDAGDAYVKYLREVAEKSPPAFICHFYNTYFAHSAGGRMIGTKVSESLFNARVFDFYTYDGDMKELLDQVRDRINDAAEAWSREEKDLCLEETEKSFAYSGSILRNIITPAPDVVSA